MNFNLTKGFVIIEKVTEETLSLHGATASVILIDELYALWPCASFLSRDRTINCQRTLAPKLGTVCPLPGMSRYHGKYVFTNYETGTQHW